MKKHLLASIILILVLCFSFSVNAFAENGSSYDEPITDITTEPFSPTEPIPTQAYTNPPAPTEPDVSPQPAYTPAEQDFQEKEWKEIQLDLAADPAPGKQSFAGIQNDKSKGNDSIVGFLIVGLVLIFLSLAGFTFVFLYRPYKNKAVPARQTAVGNTSASRSRYTKSEKAPNRKAPSKNHTENRRPYNPDDYNDGF